MTATFERKTDADKWARDTEADMGRRRYFPQHEADRHTVAELVDRQLEAVKADRPHDYERQGVLLGWWKGKLGAYSLATVNLPDLIGRHRDKLQTEEGMSPGTVNRYLAALSGAFTNAVRETRWRGSARRPSRAAGSVTSPMTNAGGCSRRAARRSSSLSI